MKVKKIEDLFTKRILKTEINIKTPDPRLLEKPIEIVDDKSKTARFEKEVFNYFYENKKSLGIEKVYNCINMSVDGAIVLKNRKKLVLLEMKYNLDWRNACVARIEFQRFVERDFANYICRNKKPERALIVFKSFVADWDKQAGGRQLKNGWYRFYEDEKPLREGAGLLPVDIVQFDKRKLSFERWE